jgi:hypothetical protein
MGSEGKPKVGKDLNKAIGNVIDRWEQLPNDIRSDVGFENLDEAIRILYEVQVTRPLTSREAGPARGKKNGK